MGTARLSQRAPSDGNRESSVEQLWGQVGCPPCGRGSLRSLASTVLSGASFFSSPACHTPAPPSTSNISPFLHTHQALPISMTFANAGAFVWIIPLSSVSEKYTQRLPEVSTQCPRSCISIFDRSTQPPRGLASGSCSTSPSFHPPNCTFLLTCPGPLLDDRGLPGLPLCDSGSAVGQVFS